MSTGAKKPRRRALIRMEYRMNSSSNSSPPQRPAWLEAATREAWEKAQRILKDRALTHSLSKYLHEPAAFCQDMFSETYTDDVIKVMNSVRDNRVTIARSANAVGKSHAAARTAVWFF